MSSSVFCCVHPRSRPRITSPSPPPRPPAGTGPTTPATSLNGVLWLATAAALPADHPHRLLTPLPRLNGDISTQCASGTTTADAKTDQILRSPGLSGRLRMKLSRRAGRRRRGRTTTVAHAGDGDSGAGADAGGSTSRTRLWDLFSPRDDAEEILPEGLASWDVDARALTSEEVLRQADSASVVEGDGGSSIGRLRREGDGAVMRVSDSVTSTIPAEGPQVGEGGSAVPAVSKGARIAGKKSSRSLGFAKKSIEWLRPAMQRQKTTETIRIEELPHETGSNVHEKGEESGEGLNNLPQGDISPLLLATSADLAEQVAAKCTGSSFVNDGDEQSAGSSSSMTPPRTVGRKSVTPFAFRSLPARHGIWDGEADGGRVGKRVVDCSSEEDDLLRVVGQDELTVRNPDGLPALGRRPVSMPLLTDPPLEHDDDATKAENSKTNPTGTTTDDVIWQFHRRERSTSVVLFKDGDLLTDGDENGQANGTVRMQKKAPGAAGDRVHSPLIFDASSSIYSRPCSADNERAGNLSQGPSRGLDASLANWPLAIDGNTATAVPRGAENSQIEDGKDNEQSTEVENALSPTHNTVSPSPKESAELPQLRSRPSQSSHSTLSHASKKSRFWEAFTPPKKSVRKRRSIFRFLRPGSRRQLRSQSTPVLRSLAGADGPSSSSPSASPLRTETTAGEEILTVQYELTQAPTAGRIRQRAKTEGNLRALMWGGDGNGTDDGGCPETVGLPEPALERERGEEADSTASLGATLAVPLAEPVAPDEVFRRLSVSRPHQPSILRTLTGLLSPADAGLVRQHSAATLALPIASSDIVRRPSLIEYERSLSATGDSRRRPSIMDVQSVSGEEEAGLQEKKPTVKHRDTESDDEDEEELDPLMTRALRRHQQEKAMFRSESKRRESLLPSHSVPELARSTSFGPPGRSASTNAIPAGTGDPATIEVNPRMSIRRDAGLRLQIPYDDVRDANRQLSSEVSSQAVLPSLKTKPSTIRTPAASIGPQTPSPRTPRIGTTRSSWSRFASHTRRDRCGSAGPVDGIRVRDFAASDEPSTAVEQASPTSKHSIRATSKKIKHGGALITSRSMTFGGIVRYYHNLLTGPSDSSSQNRRTSVAISGELKHPELEMLPPVTGTEYCHDSIHDHLKKIEEQVLGAGEAAIKPSKGLHDGMRRKHAGSESSNISFRSNSMFQFAPFRDRHDSAIDSGSPTEHQGASDIPTSLPVPVKNDSDLQLPHVIEQLDGASSASGTHKSLTPSKAEAWSQMYRSCLSRHTPAASTSESRSDNGRRSQSGSTITSAQHLQPPKARSPEARNSHLDPNVRIRRFPSVTVVDDRRGHLRSVSLISAQSLKSLRSATTSDTIASGTGIQRNSTFDLIQFIQAKEKEERDKLLGLSGNRSGGLFGDHG